MRNLIVCNIMSLDGYYTGPSNNVMVLPMDKSFDAYNLERLRAADTVLLGGTSYRMFGSFWPGVADNPDASPTNQEFSKLYNNLVKVVVSDQMTPEDAAEAWRDTTRIVRRRNAHEEIAALKLERGRDIVMFGSHTLWNDLLMHDLVDQLHLMIGPVVLGAGTPIFDGQPPVSLQLGDTRTWNDSGNVLVRYDVHRQET